MARGAEEAVAAMRICARRSDHSVRSEHRYTSQCTPQGFREPLPLASRGDYVVRWRNHPWCPRLCRATVLAIKHEGAVDSGVWVVLPSDVPL